MKPNDEFKPKLGKIRSKAKTPYLSSVLKAASRAGGLKMDTAHKVSRFVEGRGAMGRGRAATAALNSRSSTMNFNRRAIVKVRIVKLAGMGLGACKAHISYLARDGVSKDDSKGRFYDRHNDHVEPGQIMERSTDDRHQFRAIVTAEDGDQYDDLKALTRRLMEQVETDLGTKLDWVAVDHFNTGHPHTHIVLRGKDDMNKDLIISRDYISRGMAQRASDLVTLDLGPRTQEEIDRVRQKEVHQERFTSIDKSLLKDINPEGVVDIKATNPMTHALKTARLRKLEVMGLAQQRGPNQWHLSDQLEPILRRMGERGDIIKALHHGLDKIGQITDLSSLVMHDHVAEREPHPAQLKPITGQVLRRGLVDELSDRHYVVIEALDGRAQYFDLGKAEALPSTPQGSIIELTPNVPSLRASDPVIASIADRNQGVYSIEAHQRLDPTASDAFAEAHVRRLEAVRRSMGSIDRKDDGQFMVGKDYLSKAMDYERKQVELAPIKLDVKSIQTLERQSRFNGMTWLDQEIECGNVKTYAKTGFGKQVEKALNKRLQWLHKEGLAQDQFGIIRPQQGFTEALKQRDLARTIDQLSKDLGMAYREAQNGSSISGRLTRKIMVGNEAYGLVERSRDFSLVTWRDVLEKQIGKPVSGMVRESGINWKLQRGSGIDME